MSYLDTVLQNSADLRKDPSNAELWLYGSRKPILSPLLEGCFSAPPSTTSINYISANRAFLVNNELTDIDLKISGITYSIASGEFFDCSKDEQSFLLDQASTLGYDVAVATFADWLAATGSRAIFTE